MLDKGPSKKYSLFRKQRSTSIQNGCFKKTTVMASSDYNERFSMKRNLAKDPTCLCRVGGREGLKLVKYYKHDCRNNFTALLCGYFYQCKN